MADIAQRDGQALAALDGVSFTRIGLFLSNPDLPYSEFENLCFTLGEVHKAVRFAIGDAILLGEKLYGERCYQALESLNLSEKGRMEYLRVSEKVPRSVRRKELSWSHHRAVASLPVPEQRKWLKTASERQMSHHGLREALRDGKPPERPTVCRCCGRDLDD